MSNISPPPPPAGRPKLKLSVSSSGSRQPSISEPNAVAPAVATPLATPKIRIKAVQTPTTIEPASATSTAKTKAGRQTKPTSKLIESKKRGNVTDDDEEPLSASQPSKKIRVKTPLTGRAHVGGLILKSKGKPPVHPPGEGYDSESSEQEEDPVIEEQFILRMMPGEHCDYVRRCMEEGKIGIRPSQGGADFTIKWLRDETRRAIVNVKGQAFAAVMVELPTITEGMKSWDRKSFMKSADLCHMLLVFQKVSSEDEAKKAPLPPMVQPGFKWPHGLTPPMHDAVNQRFAKVLSRNEIERKQAEVKKLLTADRLALSSKWEWDDKRQQSEEEDGADGDEMDYSQDEEDADGEADESGYFPADGYADGAMVLDGEDQDALEAEMEAALFEDDDTQHSAMLEAATPATNTQLEGVTPVTMGSGATPAGPRDGEEDEDDEGESVVSEEDDSDGSADDHDSEEYARVKGVREDISKLKRDVAHAEAELAQHANNKILRNRVEARLKSLRGELAVKMSSLGEDDEENEE